MRRDEVTAAVVDAVRRVAPDRDVATVDPSADLAQDLGLDSLDFVRLVELVHDATGVAIPEARFPDASTVEGIVRLVLGGDRART